MNNPFPSNDSYKSVSVIISLFIVMYTDELIKKKESLTFRNSNTELESDKYPIVVKLEREYMEVFFKIC